MTSIKTKIGKNGRVVIPATYRKALGLKAGDDVVLELVEGEVRIITPAAALQRAQTLVRRYVPREQSLVKELLEERRKEAARG